MCLMTVRGSDLQGQGQDMLQRAALVVCIAAGREVDAVAQVRAAQHRLGNPGNDRVCVQQLPETGARYAST